MSFYYLESTSTDPYYNLALEEYVFNLLPRTNEYFILWQNDNSIIVGKHQNTIEEINLPYVQEKQIRVARRLSGGGAVYHDLGNLNYTFIMDAAANAQLDLSSFCIPVIQALSRLEIEAKLSGRNDITIDGKKFSGSAQYLRTNRVMHHGTLMFDSNLAVLAQALNVSPDKIESKGIKSVRSRVTNIREHLKKDMMTQEFKEVIRRYITQANQMLPYDFTQEDRASIEKIRQQRYATWDWNFGISPAYSIRKERRVEGCGKIQVFMDIEKGAISAFTTRGDYFAAGDAAELEQAVLGCRVNEPALKTVLSGLNIDSYFKNLTAEELIQIILL